MELRDQGILGFRELSISSSSSKSDDIHMVYHMHWNAVVRFVVECEHKSHLLESVELLAALSPMAAFSDYISSFELRFFHIRKTLSGLGYPKGSYCNAIDVAENTDEVRNFKSSLMLRMSKLD